MDINKILWPNDFTPAAHGVLPFVQSLAEQHDAELHLLHVATDISNYEEYWGEPNPRFVRKMHEFMQEGARKKLKEFCQDELATCSAYKVHVELGDPGEEILKAVDELDIDLVVMAIRGSEAEHGLGSVAQKVLGGTKVPVFAITPRP